MLYSLYLTRTATNIAVKATNDALKGVEAAELANEIAAVAAREAVEAAAEANRINRRAYVTDQRPWVSAEPFISGPLTWGSQGCRIEIKFVLENTGRSPAIDAWIETDIAASPTFVKWPEVLPALVKQGRGRQMGLSLFPGQKRVYRCGLTVSSHKIAEWSKWWKDTHGIEADDILPVVFGSVLYSSVNGEVHGTPFIFDVVRSIPIDNSVAISPTIGDIPADQLRLDHRWQQGSRPS